MLRHLVLFKFKPETSRQEQERLLSALRELPAVIPEIRKYEVGFDVTRTARSFDAAIHSLFDDAAALDRYQTHPDHLKIGGVIAAACAQVAVVDFEV